MRPCTKNSSSSYSVTFKPILPYWQWHETVELSLLKLCRVLNFQKKIRASAAEPTGGELKSCRCLYVTGLSLSCMMKWFRPLNVLARIRCVTVRRGASRCVAATRGVKRDEISLRLTLLFSHGPIPDKRIDITNHLCTLRFPLFQYEWWCHNNYATQQDPLILFTIT